MCRKLTILCPKCNERDYSLPVITEICDDDTCDGDQLENADTFEICKWCRPGKLSAIAQNSNFLFPLPFLSYFVFSCFLLLFRNSQQETQGPKVAQEGRSLDQAQGQEGEERGGEEAQTGAATGSTPADLDEILRFKFLHLYIIMQQ